MEYIFEQIIVPNDLYALLDEHIEDVAEKDQLILIVKDTIHHKVLDVILESLEDYQKMYLISEVNEETSHPEVLSKLSKWVENFDDIVCKVSKETEKDLLQLMITSVELSQ